ncbi:GNAT family N-acetyltransferase [Ralstonia pseudosolanacearum]
MPQMADPSHALKSFQDELHLGTVNSKQGELDRDLFVYLDHPGGEPRFTYVRLDGKLVTALMMFAVVEPIRGIPCFQIGYAVAEQYRNQGRAKDAVVAAIGEMRNGFGRAGIPRFFVEAIVGADNAASNRVAAGVISAMPTSMTDEYSGHPALQYLLEVTT